MATKILNIFFCCFLLFTTTLGFATSNQKNEIRNALNYLSSYPNFDHSLQRHGASFNAYLWLFSAEDIKNKDYFKFKVKADKVYKTAQKFPSLINSPDHIPRIIHQIWIGTPVPERYQDFIATWQGWNGWTYLLWTDEEVKNLHMQNQSLFDKTENFGEKSDILRYELLYLFGGLYVDTDFICLDAGFFNFAHQHYSFYIGVEPLEHSPMSCCNALMASAPKHPIMKKIIDNLKSHAKKHHKESPVERTGPRYITKMISSNLGLLKGGIIFPPTFFYPIHSQETEAFIFDQKLFVHPETVAVHLWDGSWREKDELDKKSDDKSILNKENLVP